MKDSVFNETWEPRIGTKAAELLLSAYQYVPHFFISLGVALLSLFEAMAVRPVPLWLSILGSVAILTWIFFAILASWTNSSRRKRAAREAFEYLGRPAQCRKNTFPSLMLQNSQRFDNFLVMKGIPQRGNYTSGAVANAYIVAAKRKSSSLGN